MADVGGEATIQPSPLGKHLLQNSVNFVTR